MKKMLIVLEAIPVAMERSFTPKTNYILVRLAQVTSWCLAGVAVLLMVSMEELSTTWGDFLVRGPIAALLLIQLCAFFPPMEEAAARFKAQLKSQRTR